MVEPQRGIEAFVACIVSGFAPPVCLNQAQYNGLPSQERLKKSTPFPILPTSGS
jgi:hypothetical protein